MAETLESSFFTNQVECTFRGRKTLCKVSGRPCTVALVGVGDAGDDIVRIPCISCTGFRGVRYYWNFYGRQVTALIRQHFCFVRLRCAERLGAAFVSKFLPNGTQICPLLSNSDDGVPYVVVRVDMEVRRSKNPWREGYCGPLPRSFKIDWSRLPDFSSMEAYKRTAKVPRSFERELEGGGGGGGGKEEDPDSEEEEPSTPCEVKRPCDHVYHHPQMLSLDWYRNSQSCPICTYHQSTSNSYNDPSKPSIF